MSILNSLCESHFHPWFSSKILKKKCEQMQSRNIITSLMFVIRSKMKSLAEISSLLQSQFTATAPLSPSNIFDLSSLNLLETCKINLKPPDFIKEFQQPFTYQRQNYVKALFSFQPKNEYKSLNIRPNSSIFPNYSQNNTVFKEYNLNRTVTFVNFPQYLGGINIFIQSAFQSQRFHNRNLAYIDFEMYDKRTPSEVAVVIVSSGEVVERYHKLIRISGKETEHNMQSMWWVYKNLTGIDFHEKSQEGFERIESVYDCIRRINSKYSPIYLAKGAECEREILGGILENPDVMEVIPFIYSINWTIPEENVKKMREGEGKCWFHRTRDQKFHCALQDAEMYVTK